MSRDLEMMLSPSDWPQWPYLPLKRRSKVQGQLPEFGVLAEVGIDDPPELRFAANTNLWNSQQLTAATFVKADPAQLVAEGWEVD